VLNLGRVSYDGAAGELSSREPVHLMAGFPLETKHANQNERPSELTVSTGA